jgi:thioesterase domain-containing protein/phenylacetate-coenzyme A ligase PaaK-like adenylate-forming protein
VRRKNCGSTILLHTSATTGRRKVVPISAENLTAMIENTLHALELGPSDRLLLMAKLFHTQGVLSPFAQLQAGGSVIVTSNFTPRDLLGYLSDLRPTWYTCGPTLHRRILTDLQIHGIETPTSLRFVRSGGAPLPQDLRTDLEQILRVPVLDVYGLTETGAVACTSFGSHCLDSNLANDSAHKDAVGKSMGPEIAIMSSQGELVPHGEEGEVVVAGPTVISGYLNDPLANREAFQGRWFRTGDLGRLDGEGYLYITGRLKEIINRGGQKIIPNEIDSVLLAHEAVLEAATFGMPHATLGEDVACAVVLEKGCETSSDELRAFAAKSLAAFKVPRTIYRVESIPYGATGKPQRLVLRQRFLEARPGISRAIPPGKPALAGSVPDKYQNSSGAGACVTPKDINRTLEDIWSRYLGIDNSEQQEDFFVLGGDSILAVMMLAELDVLFALKTKLSQAIFFEEPTLGTLSGMVVSGIASRGVDSSSHAVEVVPVNEGRGHLPLFMIPADGEEGSRFRRLSKKLGERWPLSLVRPVNSWHEPSVHSIEEAGAFSATAIRAVHPQGPYVVGGFCSGGVVAFETVRQLELQGETALLVLFDVPTPGVPHVFFNRASYLRAAYDATLRSWRAKSAYPILGLGLRILRRFAWFAIRVAKPRNDGMWKILPLRWLCSQAQAGYFSFYRPWATKTPILHFMARDEPDALLADSRGGWDGLGLSGVTPQWLTGDHNQLFSEGNMNLMAQVLSHWVQAKLSSQ